MLCTKPEVLNLFELHFISILSKKSNPYNNSGCPFLYRDIFNQKNRCKSGFFDFVRLLDF